MAHNFSKTKATSQKATVADDRIPCTARKLRPKFVLAHSPQGWEWSEHTGRYLPRLKMIALKPGANGIRKGAGGHLGAMASLMGKGWTVLPDDIEVLETDDETGEITSDTGYMVSYKTTSGTTYLETWARPVVIGNTTDFDSQYDSEGFDAWRVLLVDKGHVRPPNPAILAQLCGRQEVRASRRIPEAHDGAPHIQKYVEHEQSKLADMQAAAEKSGTKTRRKVSRKSARKATNG